MRLSLYGVVSLSCSHDDIALVRLSTPAQLNDNVQTLCLPDDDATISIHSHCYTTGWGLTYRYRDTQGT